MIQGRIIEPSDRKCGAAAFLLVCETLLKWVRAPAVLGKTFMWGDTKRKCARKSEEERERCPQ
jgi:hypothetical protein